MSGVGRNGLKTLFRLCTKRAKNVASQEKTKKVSGVWISGIGRNGAKMSGVGRKAPKSVGSWGPPYGIRF